VSSPLLVVCPWVEAPRPILCKSCRPLGPFFFVKIDKRGCCCFFFFSLPPFFLPLFPRHPPFKVIRSRFADTSEPPEDWFCFSFLGVHFFVHAPLLSDRGTSPSVDFFFPLTRISCPEQCSFSPIPLFPPPPLTPLELTISCMPKIYPSPPF